MLTDKNATQTPVSKHTPLLHDPAGRDAMNLMDYFAAHAPPVPEWFDRRKPRSPKPDVPETPKKWNERVLSEWRYYQQEGEYHTEGLRKYQREQLEAHIKSHEAWQQEVLRIDLDDRMAHETSWRWLYATYMMRTRNCEY